LKYGIKKKEKRGPDLVGQPWNLMTKLLA
jgi:hypothetical protein